MFLNPLMLAGIGGAVMPLVLHLLSRARYRNIEWGAMMFLTRESSRRVHRMKLRQIILLLLRMGIIAALAVSLARPIVQRSARGRFAAISQEARITAVIVLDRSASMGYEENGHARMDAARQAALSVLANLHRGDEAALILIGDAADDSNVQPTSDLQALAARIEDLRAASGRADIAQGLAQAQRILLAEQNAAHELYLICDRQSLSWENVNDAMARNWSDAQGESVHRPRFFVIPVGSDEVDNVAIETIEIAGPPVVRGATVDVEVRIRNYGAVPRVAMPLVVNSGGKELARTTIDMAAGATTSVKVPAKFIAAGPQFLSAKVTATGLRSDDQLDRAIYVLDPARVLVICGDPAVTDSAASVFKLAVAPYASSGENGVDPAIVKTIGVDAWPHTPLDSYDVVVLSNIGDVPYAQLRDLERFVYSGGGLLIAPGDRSRADALNWLLDHENQGMMPVEVDANRGAFDPSTGATSLASLDATHPIFQFAHGRSDPAARATILRYITVRLKNSAVRAIATFANDQPALLESSFGKGRVMLLATSLDPSWNTLPLSSFYLPAMQSIVRYLSAGAVVDRNLSPGAHIDITLDSAPDRPAMIVMPSGRQRTIDLTKVGSRYELHFTDTQQTGRYTLSIPGMDRPLHYVVAAPRGESDLTPLTLARWDWLEKNLNFTRIDPVNENFSQLVDSQRRGLELHLAGLMIVVALALIELLLTRFWSARSGAHGDV